MDTATVIFMWLAFAVACAIIASSKGRSGFGWFIIGLPFGLLALIVVAVMPSLKGRKDAPSPDTHVKCPDCRELVLMDARKCKHCGCPLVPIVT